MNSRLRYVTVGLLSTGQLSIDSGLAWADDESIILDLVRHGESIDNNAGIIDTPPPGTALDAAGFGQARRRYRNPEGVRNQHRRGLRLGRAQDPADGGAVGYRAIS